MKLGNVEAVGRAAMVTAMLATKTTRHILRILRLKRLMAIDKNNNELNIGDHVLYVYNNPLAAFSLRGIVVNLTTICSARDGEMLYLVDVELKFIDKTPAKPGQTVRVWSGELERYDAERTRFV